MAAKKAPAKKMAAPKAAPKKKTSNVGSANAAEKRMMDKKAQSRRTDAAGRSGMGETVTSNVTYKGSGLGNMPASDTAAAAARKAGKAGKDMTKAYNKSLRNAQKAAGWPMDPDRPGVYVSPKQKPASAADLRKREERAKVIAAARRKRLGK